MAEYQEITGVAKYLRMSPRKVRLVADLVRAGINVHAFNHRTVAEILGMVRMLGVATPVRFSQTPDIPTFLEQGIDLTIRPWLGILGPANMPADVVTRLNDELNAVLKDPKFQATLRNNDVQIAEPSTPKEYAAFLNTELEQWGKIIREAGLKVEE